MKPEELTECIKFIGMDQADFDTLEKLGENSCKNSYRAYCPSKVTMIRTNSDSVKFIAETEDYDFSRSKPVKDIEIKKWQHVQIQVEYLQLFLDIVKQSEKYIRKREGLEPSGLIDIYVTKDRPVKLRMKLIKSNSHNYKDEKEVVFWIAPRISTED